MGDENDWQSLRLDGLHLGDWVLRAVPATETDGHLDDPESRERRRQQEADQRAAQHGDGGAVVPAVTQAGADVDASLAAARAAQAPPGAPLPTLLRDPLTGKVIGSV